MTRAASSARTPAMPPTARALMVWPVKTVAAQATVVEACALMDRYLISAVPVLLEGEVAGILTRRLAGGLLGHGLGEIDAAAFMLSAHCVTPDQPLPVLAELVRRHNPRIVPVIDAGRLVGLITRTAILRALADLGSVGTPPATSAGSLPKGPETGRGDRVALERLPEALWPILSTVSTLAAECAVAVCMVGGLVRDLLLEVPGGDLDLLVEGESGAIGRFIERLTEALQARRLDHVRFGTAVLELPHDPCVPVSSAGGPSDVQLCRTIDIATARIETYGQPAALPDVEPGSLWLDLRRRDFTFNSLAIRLDGDHLGLLMDPYGGRRDLVEGRIRVLHGLSFVDDPTRMFRAVRFESRFGFRIDAETERLLRSAVHLGLVERLSGERLGAELELILSEDRAGDSVARLAELELLPTLRLHPPSPEGLALWMAALARAAGAHERLLASHALSPLPTALPALWQIRLAVLSWGMSAGVPGEAPESIHAVLARLAVRGPVAARIEHACRLAAPLLERLANPLELPPSGLVALLEPAGVETWALLWSLAGSGLAAERLELFLLRLRGVKAPLDGNDLRALGLSPGPAFKEILQTLRARALDGAMSREEAVAYVRAVTAGQGGPSGT